MTALSLFMSNVYANADVGEGGLQPNSIIAGRPSAVKTFLARYRPILHQPFGDSTELIWRVTGVPRFPNVEIGVPCHTLACHRGGLDS